ncbi:MAG: purine-nucleoside phosphorylase [candidate division Zixibacteria bacterium]|nr:purine-nucleoside phosphorylase [Candidatus Tariuqbacter arcticus]
MLRTEATEDWEKLKEAAGFLKDAGFYGMKLSLVLGTGLGGLADEVEDAVIIDTDEIPGYPSSSVEGHYGRIVMGTLSGLKVLVFQGRVHYYEGHSPLMVCAPVIISSFLGLQSVLLTNAAGAVRDDFKPGDLMLIDDTVNLSYMNPLLGTVSAEVRGGALSFDSIAYPLYVTAALEAALEEGVTLHRGILGMTAGPTYETPAEVQMLSYAGADAASMSTIPEIIMAKRLGLKVLTVSCLTNMATGISPNPLTHREVQIVAGMVSDKFRAFMKNVVGKIRELHQW